MTVSNEMRTSRLLTIFLLLSPGITLAGDKDVQRFVEKHAKPLESSGKVCGFVIGGIQGDQRVVLGFGQRVMGKGERPDGDTVYEIGSVTKGLLTTIFADMVLDGTVRRDDLLRDVLPKEVKVKSYQGVDGEHPIQLEHLAMHTAYLNDFPDDVDPSLESYNRSKIFAYLGRYPTFMQPGAIFDYSNYGASVLGLALSEKSGLPYDELFRKRIFAPLKMERTTIRPVKLDGNNIAPPYSTDLKPASPFPDSDLANLCGGIRSCGHDMMKFATACVDERSKLYRSVRLAIQPRFGSYARGGKIESLRGYSWYYPPTEGILTAIHPGDTMGYSCILIFDTTKKRAVFMLCNTRAASIVYQTGMNIYHELGGYKKQPMSLESK